MMKRLLAFALVLTLLASLVSIATADTTTFRILKRNMTGSDVLDAQELLKDYGYYEGELDGKFGYNMLVAVKRFQSLNKLKVDGKIGSQTYAKLNSSSVVKNTFSKVEKGNVSKTVEDVQKLLKQYLYYTGETDGVFGEDTRSAVKNFQASVGIKADGIVGPKTYDAINNRTHRIFSNGSPARSLREGSRGYDVYVLQEKLRSLNYYTGSSTGYFNTATVDAIKAFQRDNNLSRTGICSANVLKYLWPTEQSPTASSGAKIGAEGRHVSDIQMRLKVAGFLMGNADGVFGIETYNAVVAFQKAHKLTADGAVGKATLAELNKIDITKAVPEVVSPSKPAVGVPTYKLRKGDNSTRVKKMQLDLIDAGFLASGEADGVFGKRTYNAVIKLQKFANIRQDGVVGQNTWAALYNKLSK